MARATQSKTLVIVESPTKAKTISKFLGKDFLVESSYGHMRDLPKSKLGIDLENNFEPQYIIPLKSKKQVTALKKLAEKAGRIILATDEDREGEAIAWHIAKILDSAISGEPERIVFHEITKGAIEDALKTPRTINVNLVDAQQGRRVLDRLVGYKLSPFLWKKIARGLSAGRVQSVALRLIVDREEEIKKFIPEEYHTITATLATKKNEEFEAALYKIDGELIPKLGIKTSEEAKAILENLKKAEFAVSEVERKETKKNPLPPFITSTLQQTASKQFGYSSKKTMFIAQQLYENGLITYMRTDSVNLSKEALTSASKWIEANLGKKYKLPSPRVFKTKSRMAQEAHEAIRPTSAETTPESLTLEKDHQKIYELIWRRFIASQLPPAEFDATRVVIDATASGKPSYSLHANGNIMRFDGFLKVWRVKFEDKELPELKKSDPLNLIKTEELQHFTEPPPRYNEASLIKILEQFGIGRPSTYAPIISVIQERNYVEKVQGKFFPTEIGTLVNNVLTEHFPEIVDIQFTAKMEEEFDEIAEGKISWQNVIKEFYDPFAKHLAEKYETVTKEEVADQKTDIICEKCGKPMVVKFGRFGKFLACSGYPDCKNTKPLKDPPKSIGLQCPDCLASEDRKENPGDIIERRVSKGRARGKIFWGCSRYPDCKYASWTDPRKPAEEKVEGTNDSKGTS